MDRKAMAKETLQIMEQGYYLPVVDNENGQETKKKQIVIKEDIEQSVKESILISPADAEKILQKYSICKKCSQPHTRVENISTVRYPHPCRRG